ncbi:ABC transporter permease [Pseudomonas aeruginosa]|nr:ABC transporter permease [Pseudomonas aeruginosa]
MNGRNPLWTFSGVRQAAWLFFAFLYIPILVLVVLSFNSGQSATLWESFSLKWYAVVANDPEILRARRTRCSSPPSPPWPRPSWPPSPRWACAVAPSADRP